MIPYLLLVLVIIVSLLFSRKQQKIAYVFILLIMLFLGFFRADSVGTDVLFSHAPNFDVASYNDLEGVSEFGFEPGFMFLMACWKDFISNNYMQFFGVCFIFTTISFFSFFKKYSSFPLFTVLIYILFCLFYNSMNMIRQFFCVAILFVALDFYFRYRLFWVYTLVVIICSLLFHVASLTFLIVPFLDKVSLKHKTCDKLILSIIVLFSLLSFYYRDFVISRFEILAQIELLAKFESYVSGSNMNDETNNVTAIIQSFFCLIIIWSYKIKKKTDLYYLSFIIGCVSYNILSCFSTHTWRIGLPFILLGLIAITDLWTINKKNRGRFIVKPAIIVFYFVYFINSSLKEIAGVFPYISRIELF